MYKFDSEICVVKRSFFERFRPKAKFSFQQHIRANIILHYFVSKNKLHRCASFVNMSMIMICIKLNEACKFSMITKYSSDEATWIQIPSSTLFLLISKELMILFYLQFTLPWTNTRFFLYIDASMWRTSGYGLLIAV